MTTQELQRTTIVVADIEHRGAGKSIKITATDGTLYGAWPKPYGGLFNVGETYEVEFVDNERAGVIYHDITKVRHMGPHSDPLRPLKQAAASASARPPTKPTKTKEATHATDAERMWVSNQLGRMTMANLVRNAEDELIDTVNMLRRVWAATFGADTDH